MGRKNPFKLNNTDKKIVANPSKMGRDNNKIGVPDKNKPNKREPNIYDRDS